MTLSCQHSYIRKMTYQPSSLGQCMQHYKSICVSVMICATLANIQTHWFQLVLLFSSADGAIKNCSSVPYCLAVLLEEKLLPIRRTYWLTLKVSVNCLMFWRSFGTFWIHWACRRRAQQLSLWKCVKSVLLAGSCYQHLCLVETWLLQSFVVIFWRTAYCTLHRMNTEKVNPVSFVDFPAAHADSAHV